MRPDVPGPSATPSGHWLTVPIPSEKRVFILPKEAFFPERSTYLGRAARKEPVRQSNVLFSTGDHS